ncbi:MAG TPA: zinc ABC transporter substrate-binding protein [Solirubrobacteraceae bacterium]|jgi:zinc/manganese transport system substrate-binding protein|nr:zinc ABC transporter substrate-binding protein [Solirubrobacteraceae bacterium]
MKIAARSSLPRLRFLALPVAMLLLVLSVAGCGSSSSSSSGASSSVSGSSNATVAAVAAENEYANVLEQIGGKYVKVTAIESNPNTDPHTYEASASTAQAVAGAKMLIENGVGYDTFMGKIESAGGAGSESSRKVINVQKLLGLPESTPNPHLWYKPSTMPAVAKAIVGDLSALEPAHAAYFQANDAAFEASLRPWLKALAQFSKRYPGSTVATTEPVADYMLEAAGIENLTPFSMQADIMNGTDPAPQNVSLQNGLFSGHKVKVFVHNQQVTDSLTESFVKAAKAAGIPVVGVYETMPTPGYDYQSWMLAEVKALEKAVSEHVSTEKL